MKKTTFALLLFAGAFAATIFMACPKPPVTPNLPTHGMIKGYVFSEIVVGNDNEGLRKVNLPDVLVTVTDSLGTVVDTVQTDLDGFFKTKRLKRGNYKLCLNKDGFNTTCHSAGVVYGSNHPGPLRIDLKSNDYLYGSILLRDGRPGIYRNAVFGAEFFTIVKADLGGVVRQVRANVAGEYLLSEVKRGAKWEVTGVCQKAVVSQNYLNNNGLLDLTLPNNSPVLRGIASTDASGQAVMRTSPGQLLKVRAVAEDTDNHSLTFSWIPWTDAPGSSFGNTDQVKWQLGTQPGNYKLFVLVMDGFGGTAYQSYDIEAGDKSLRFSGIVREIDGSGTVADAQIKVNGQLAATTDAKGFFKFKLPQAAVNRYVLNIEKSGYMLHSSILFNDATGKEYFLVKSTLEEFDPKNAIDLLEKEDEYTRFVKDNQQPFFSRPPARVIIPPKAIIDSAGNKVTSNVLVGLRNVDLFDSRGLMPGDYGAIRGGQQKQLESFGAVDVQIRDKANPNVRYRLDPTMTAEVSIPIANFISASAPVSTTFWDYNETSGLWEDIGTLTRVGNLYIGKTNRFSTLNADVEFTNATCFQLLDNPNAPAVFPVAVTISVPTSGAPKVFNQTLTAGDLPYVIVRLPPPPANVTISVDDASTSPVQTQVVQTRNVVPDALSLSPTPPFDYCNDVYLLLPTKPLPTNPGSVFLSRIQNDENDAIAYYKLIGAYNAAGQATTQYGTLSAWKAMNGFSGIGPDTYNASYFNAGDLGFWRGMHQKNNAFYVSNFYNDFDSNDDVDGGSQPSPDNGTVAMEYTPISGGIAVTKFLVFDNIGVLTTFADLDGYGNKYIPGLCIECHGGENLDWDNTNTSAGPVFSTPADLEAHYTSFLIDIPKFLPFDLQSFEYSLDPDFERIAQDNDLNLTGLNNEVLKTNSVDIPEIVEYLKASYGITTTTTTLTGAGPYQDNAFPLGWSSTTPPFTLALAPNTFYSQVVGPSCRGCHITRTYPGLRFGLATDFTNDFSGTPPGLRSVIGPAVCQNAFYIMPNAKVPFQNFWESKTPPRAEELRKFLGLTNCN